MSNRLGGTPLGTYPADQRDGAGIHVDKLGLTTRARLEYRALQTSESPPSAGLVAVQDAVTGEFQAIDFSNLPTSNPADGGVGNVKLAAAPALTLKGNSTNASAQPQDVPLSEVAGVTTFFQDGTGAVQDNVAAALKRLPVYPEQFYQVGDTDDGPSINRALAASANVVLKKGKTYTAKNIVVPGQRVLDCSGAIVNPAPGADWMIRLTGYRPIVRGLVSQDNDGAVKASQLTAPASANTLAVQNATGFQAGQTLIVRLATGRWHPSEILSVAGNVITLRVGLPSGAATGADVFASFGLVSIRDAIYALVDSAHIVNCAFGIVTSNLATDTNKSFLSNVTVDGCKYVALSLGRNTHNVFLNQVQLWGGSTPKLTFTGNGTTTNYPLGANPIYLKRDVTVYVNGVLKALTTDYTLTSPTQVTFNTAPANGALVEIFYYQTGAVGLLYDQTGWTIEHSTYIHENVLSIAFQHGVFARQMTILDLTDVVSDTCQFTTCRIENCDYVTLPKFLGYAPSCADIIASTNVKAPANWYTSWTPAADTYAGGTGLAFFLDAASSISIDARQWFGPSYNFLAQGTVNWKDSTPLTSGASAPVAAGSTTFFGPAGALPSSAGDLAFLPPRAGYVMGVRTVTTDAPGASQSFTYTLRIGGVDTATVITASGASAFSGSATCFVPFTAGQAVSTKLVTSAGAFATRHAVMLDVVYVG
ncbi:putative regulator of Ras-like GTPase activity (Roadblock/LC7/MglB family) [Methylobacterium sp. BE186]|uniref:hypothetical protein n=1 Tax=Methylobacterium sp. BE186 TaxID=2817715 RepID=UPI002860961D|nr:hypothetical protein [Methylobacterium sp. BE186]MDR7037408.1 putative regulator of Ras-like GTPase activity (Roadblock/LC7/MglB family) [Methylobacterium sp. BE186]